MGDSDGGSSSDEDAYMSATGEPNLSLSPHNYETPKYQTDMNGDWMEDRGEGKGAKGKKDAPEEKLEDKDDASNYVEEEHSGEIAQPAKSCQVDVSKAANNSDACNTSIVTKLPT